jgi:hypothetical protein
MAKDSKTRFSNYKSAALPAELCRHLRGKTIHSNSLFPAIVSLFCIPQLKNGCNVADSAPLSAGSLSVFSVAAQVERPKGVSDPHKLRPVWGIAAA